MFFKIIIMGFLNFIDAIFIRIINQEPDPLNKARIRILGYILAFYLFFSAILIVSYTQSDVPLHLIRVSIIFIITILLIGVVLYTNLWRLVSHTIRGMEQFILICKRCQFRDSAVCLVCLCP